MNNGDIYSADFMQFFPPALKDDPKMIALARAVALELQITARQIEQNVIYARIDELDEQTLDILAYDLHVDWYDYSYPIGVKRQTIKDSVKVHRKLGTKYAVETALGAVFPGSRIEEWFEYGGEPYMFRVVIGVTATGITGDRQAAVLERARFYKNLRSHLEAIRYRMEESTSVHLAAVHSVGVRLEVYPHLCSAIEESASVSTVAAAVMTNRIEIAPALVTGITMNGQIPFGGYTQQTQRIEIQSF